MVIRCIEALDGFPGVKTARFLGENATQEDRNNYLIKKLEGISKAKRKVEFITCIAYVDSQGNEKIYKGAHHCRRAVAGYKHHRTSCPA